MPPSHVLAAGINFNAGGLFGSCFTYLFAGMIAGTVASFVVRGKMGCIFGNFFLGIVGAIVAYFVLNLFVNILPFQKNITTGFFGITVLASVGATLISYLFATLRKADGRYQQKLLDQSHATQTTGNSPLDR